MISHSHKQGKIISNDQSGHNPVSNTGLLLSAIEENEGPGDYLRI